MAFERHRDYNGQMSHKHGSTLILTLREHYSKDFAFGRADDDKLSDVLLRAVADQARSRLQDGKLEAICREEAA